MNTRNDIAHPPPPDKHTLCIHLDDIYTKQTGYNNLNSRRDSITRGICESQSKNDCVSTNRREKDKTYPLDSYPVRRWTTGSIMNDHN